MPVFPPGYVHRGGPCDELYHVYALRCHVDHEEDKAYYLPTLTRIYEALEPFVAGWADVRLESDQALERRVGKWLGKDGSIRTTLRKAPTGGLQKLTRERLAIAGRRYLTNNANLLHRFANGGAMDVSCFEPKGREQVYFFRTEILGSKARLRYEPGQDFRFIPHDLRLQIGGYAHQYAISKVDPINQALDIYLWQGIAPRADCDALLRRIGEITSAKHIWYAQSGFMGDEYVDAEGFSRIRHMVFESIEQAEDGCNRFGSRWVDLVGGSSGSAVSVPAVGPSDLSEQ
jgi:hypothetical protein